MLIRLLWVEFRSPKLWFFSWIPLNALILINGYSPNLFMIWLACGLQVLFMAMALVVDLQKIGKNLGGVREFCRATPEQQVAFLKANALWSGKFFKLV